MTTTVEKPMSFLELLEEDEHAISLEETLAFIEESFDFNSSNGNDADDDDETSGTCSDHSSCTMTDTDSVKSLCSGRQHAQTALPADQSKLLTNPVKPTRTASRSAKATAKRPRKQNKTEILKLREQVEELQARFTQLQKHGDTASSHATKPSPSLRAAATLAARVASEQPPNKKPRTSHVVASIWLDHAVEQYKELQKSESLNRRLKNALSKQIKLSKTLSTLFQKKASLQGFDFLLEMKKETAARKLGGNAAPALRPAEPAELHRKMEKLYLETDAVCSEICSSNDVGSVFSTSQTKHDVVFGPMFELKTNTPVSFNFKHLGQLFWKRMAENDHAALECIGSGAPSTATMPNHMQEKLLHMTLHSPVKGDVDLNGTTVISKFEELHRTTFVFSSTIVVPECDLLFREHGWLILSDTTPAEAEASPTAVFQTFYRIHTEKQDATDGAGAQESDRTFEPAAGVAEHRKYYQEFVMKSLSNKMRAHQHQIQNLLLVEMENIEEHCLPNNCPFESIKQGASAGSMFGYCK